jgi:putative endonuclease
MPGEELGTFDHAHVGFSWSAASISSMRTVSQQLGRAAEDLAVRHFTERGFSVVARNYRYRRAEVDIIAQKNQLLIFVEVKARSNDQFGDPEAFVGGRQRALVRMAAEHYIIIHNWNHAIRFDIVAVLKIDNHMQLAHFEDAF